MLELDLNLVKKGMNEPREGLRDEGVVHVGLGRKHGTDLAANGWPAESTAEMETLVASLGSDVAAQAEAKGSAKGKTGNEKACRAEAKEIIGKVRVGASIVLGKKEVPGVTMASFEAGHPLGQSTPKIAMYLEKIEPAVEKLDELLMPYLGGRKASELVSQAKKNLDTAQSEQEVEVKSLPQDTLVVYEAKGRLLRQTEEMNKVARIAFWNQSVIAGQFNKDTLKRARKSRKKDETTPTTRSAS